MSEVEETFNRIKTHKTVTSIVICTLAGKIIRSHVTGQEDPKAIAEYIPHLTVKARNTIRDLDPSNDLAFMRIKSRNFEVMVAPDKEYLLIVFQGNKGDKKDDDMS